MGNYRRIRLSGGCYFFTVVTYRRRHVFAKEAAIHCLRKALKHVIVKQPFEIQAMVVLPDHLHCIWQLPDNDADFSSRWREIKKAVTRDLKSGSPLWQPRFWEHLIRDEADWQRHVDYIHFNPVKHGLADSPCDWPWSSFERFRAKGHYSADWGRVCPADIQEMRLE